MILNKLVIDNFKGIEHFEMETHGRNVSIYGENRRGKSTIADAVSWLLYGKDMQDRTNFEIKLLDELGQIVPEARELDHSVEAVFDVATFKRVFREKWTRSRGKATAEYTGNTTEYFVNGIPVQKKEYDAQIEAIAPADVFKMVTNPMYFHSMLTWQKRRTILMQEFGNVKDEQVYDSNPDLAPLREILSGVKFEDAKKKISRQQKEINDQIEKIPARIDEAKKSIPETDGSIAALKAEADRLTAEKNAEWLRGEQLKNGAGRTEKQRRIADLQLEDVKLRGIVAEEDEKVNSAIRSRNHAANREYEDAMHRLESAERQIVSLGESAERERKTIEAARDDWKKENARTWESHEHAENTVCPTCGQHLPNEQIEAAMEKAKADFNSLRAARMAEISRIGNTAKADLDKILSDLEEQKRIAESLRSIERPALEAEYRSDYTESPRHQEIVADIQKLEAEIKELDSGFSAEAETINARISEIEAERAAILRKVAAIEQAERTKARIQELIAEQKRLNSEYEDLSKQLYLLERFTVRQCEMVEETINSHFREARFKLFDRQINGGITECCEALYHGIPVSTNTSRSENTKIGLDIIKTLSEKHGFAAPIFIDDRESISEIPDMTGIQLINLYVSPEDKTLRVEME